MQIAVRPQLLTPQAAAEFLGMSEGTLAVWRCARRYNLPYVKVGRSIRYDLNDLIGFLESRKVHSSGVAR
jgi:Helix-turn-helix domain